MKKKLLIGLGGIVLVLGVFLWQVVANLDNIVAGVIESVGSDVLQTKVSVSGVSINLKEGKAGIDGLTIANPAGFSSADLFAMKGIEVDLDLQSVGGDVLVIKSIRISDPKVVFEADNTGGSNMQALLDNMKSSSSGDNETSSGNAVKMIIASFEFTGGKVKATSTLKPGKTVDFKLPAIRMSDIGRAEGGVTADVVMQKIISKLVNNVIEATLRAEVDKALEGKKSDFKKKLGDIIRGSGNS